MSMKPTVEERLEQMRNHLDRLVDLGAQVEIKVAECPPPELCPAWAQHQQPESGGLRVEIHGVRVHGHMYMPTLGPCAPTIEAALDAIEPHYQQLSHQLQVDPSI